ncbi:glycosyl transferase [Novosphingobium soli]|uniref:Glycosyl transferase n=1 Tax=Novosphingobium soli TaxID=574956 RepID=A0ABV6CXZ1_9SPHN
MPASQTLTPSPRSPLERPRVHVLAIGGAHQFAHILPVACVLEQRHPGRVTFFVCTDAEAAAAAAQARGLPGRMPRLEVLRLPAAAAALPRKLHKAARLAAWSRRLCDADAILCAERTSTLLRRLVPDCPPLLHIPHGAGDRAVGFEKRFTLFDHVLVSGAKDRDRLIASGYVQPDACSVTGPVKLSTMLATGVQRPPLFDNGRPTILYNPHFARKHSSMAAFGRRLVEAVTADGRWNLVVAPHVRLARGWSERRRRRWEALAVPGRVIVDLGSERCSDMTYTLAADLYVGDVSSQVYEFLVRPRPCLFVDPHAVEWHESDDYAMWHFGEVIAPGADPVAAIERAFDNHAAYLGWQRERMAYSIDGLHWLADGTPTFGSRDPVCEAADEVEAFAGLGGAGQLPRAA